MKIRQETTDDYNEVYELIREAFASADHADGNEQNLVISLRDSEAFIPELSLVAEQDEELTGHILFTIATVDSAPVLALAPLSVKPKFQRQGVGSALIREGHSRAASLDYSYSVVLGSKEFYARFGYVPARALGILAPSEFPEENLMAVKLIPEAAPVHGKIVYAKEFGL